jgi:DNA-binding PadR family transcriptional regulator
MLIKRLDELERAGVIETLAKSNGHGRVYRLTEAGADLAEVIDALAVWGERWVEVTTDRCDPGFALWAWCQVSWTGQRFRRGGWLSRSSFLTSVPQTAGTGC